MNWYWFLLVPILVVAAWFGARWIRAVRRRPLYAVEEHPDFLSPEECRHLISRAADLLRESSVIHAGESGQKSKARRSRSALLDDAGDEILRGIKRRIAELTQTDIACQELFQITQYDPYGYYAPHRDAFKADRIVREESGNRSCTVIVYLNDDFKGGATNFREIAKRVKPQRGKAVLFHNLVEETGEPHPLSLHSAEMVHGGEKWLANQWIRERPHRPGGRKSKKRHAFRAPRRRR